MLNCASHNFYMSLQYSKIIHSIADREQDVAQWKERRNCFTSMTRIAYIFNFLNKLFAIYFA